MALVVKITTNDAGEKIKQPKWCLVVNRAGGEMTFCGGEFFGFGGSHCEYEQKEGRITCPECIEFIKEIKAVKL